MVRTTHGGRAYKTSQGITWQGSFYKRKRSQDWVHKPTKRVVKKPTLQAVSRSKEKEPTLNSKFGRDKILPALRRRRKLTLRERRAFQSVRRKVRRR